MGSAKGYLRDHGAMVAMLSKEVGSEMGLSKAECSQLFFASVLSDMGMVGLTTLIGHPSSEILNLASIMETELIH